MSIIGIIGVNEGDETIVTDGLTDLRSQAEEEGEAFWAIVALTPESPELIGAAVNWFIEEGVAFDLVVHPDIANEVPEEWTQAADKTTKIKGAHKKVVDRLMAEGGTHLCLLVGADQADPDDDLNAICQIAYDNGLKVMDLADGLAEFQFDGGEPDEGGEEGGDEPDWTALGAAADEGDDDALTELDKAAEEAGIDANDYPTWAELAEALAMHFNDGSAEDVPEEKPAAKGKGKAAAAPSLWTEEALDVLDAKEIKAIAVASGVEGAAKMGFTALKAALLGKKIVGQETKEEEPEKPAAKGKTSSSAKGKSAPVGEPLEGAPDTGDVELNDILALFNQGFQRLINYVQK